MALFKRNISTASRAREMTRETARQVNARSKYLAHLAAAQGYRAAANTGSVMSQTRNYIRRYPKASLGVIAGIAGLLGIGMYRRNKY
jgi:ElaB/YqjD/DUF883 family membrane-anchored ribosome-binding protein